MVWRVGDALALTIAASSIAVMAALAAYTLASPGPVARHRQFVL